MLDLKSNTRYNNLKSIVIEKKLDTYNFANLFNVVEIGENSYFNICKTIHFENQENIPETYYFDYEIGEADTWTNISFKFYNTIKLWWLICKFNNIINPFTELIPGKRIKIPNENIIEKILTIIKE